MRKVAGSTIHVPKDGNCAIYVLSRYTLPEKSLSLHWLEKKTPHIGFLFWNKIWAEALIELQLRQLLVIIPPACVKGMVNVNGGALLTNQSPPYKILPQKLGVRFFLMKVSSKIQKLERRAFEKILVLARFPCPNFADAATPELPIFGKAATKRKLISDEGPTGIKRVDDCRDPNENGNFKMNKICSQWRNVHFIYNVICHVQNMNLILDICVYYIFG